MDAVAEAQALFDYTRKLRRDFHAHPELGFQEVRTAGIVAKELSELGLEITTGVAETGVIAIIEGDKSGPVVLCRVDMDALPIEEENDVDYVSQNTGVMHACGHDGHTAMGLTLARILNQHRQELAGTVKLVFQPAEEGVGGAERMVAEGVLSNPRPDYSLSMHVWNDIPFGTIGISPGPCMAASDNFTIEIRGKGAHGAAPYASRDPIVAAGQVVSALQSVVARNVPAMYSAVISVTSIHGGTAYNVIPEKVELLGTIRTYLPEVRELVLQRVQQVVEGVTIAMGCSVDIRFEKVTPAVINDSELAGRMKRLAGELFPGDAVDDGIQTMGSEDMAFMMEDIPGCYVFIGSQNADEGLDFGHHHPRFNFDERAMPKGVALMAATVMELLG